MMIRFIPSVLLCVSVEAVSEREVKLVGEEKGR